MFPRAISIALFVLALATAALGADGTARSDSPTTFGNLAQATLHAESAPGESSFGEPWPPFERTVPDGNGSEAGGVFGPGLPSALDDEGEPLPQGYEPLDPWGRELSRDEPGVAEPEFLAPEEGFWTNVRDSSAVFGYLVLHDYRNFYTLPNMLNLGLGVGAAAILANTDLDEDFQSFIKNDIYDRKNKRWTRMIRLGGEGKYLLTVYAVSLGVSLLMEDWAPAGPLGEWAVRSLRMSAVGAPPMILLQFLGGTRPGDQEHTSHWKLFADNNAVSGHAFMGAIPFLSAASMIDNLPGKIVLYGASTVVAWTRIHDGRHYLSQSMLGWWIAFVASRAIAQTNADLGSSFGVAPLEDGHGVALTWRW